MVHGVCHREFTGTVAYISAIVVGKSELSPRPDIIKEDKAIKCPRSESYQSANTEIAGKMTCGQLVESVTPVEHRNRRNVRLERWCSAV